MYDVRGGLANYPLDHISNYTYPYNYNYIQNMQNSLRAMNLREQINNSLQNCCCTNGNINQFNLPSTVNEIEKNEVKEEDSIKNYMNKDFLYESELKEIEDKFHFNFNIIINFNENNKFYNVVKKITEKIKKIEDINENIYITKIIIWHSFKELSVYFNERIYNIDVVNCIIEEKDKEDVINICNSVMKMNFLEYQQFYEKYKNRIVKDNDYNDNNYYYKLLEE